MLVYKNPDSKIIKKMAGLAFKLLEWLAGLLCYSPNLMYGYQICNYPGSFHQGK